MLGLPVQNLPLLANASPEKKDVVIAILGASAALGGFVLVFLGTVIAAYQSVPPGSPPQVRARNRQARWPIVGAFSLSLVSVAMSSVWLVVPGGADLYWANVFMFSTELALILTLALWTTFHMLR
jgi:hypothetical protein